jgi:predicted DNA-binding transcriptional regulator AlpA
MDSLLNKGGMPRLITTREAAKVLGKSAATIRRWRYEGVGPNYVVLEGSVMYDVAVLEEYIRKNTRVPSVRAAMENAREAV